LKLPRSGERALDSVFYLSPDSTGLLCTSTLAPIRLETIYDVNFEGEKKPNLVMAIVVPLIFGHVEIKDFLAFKVVAALRALSRSENS
jgi:hypothetical protein